MFFKLYFLWKINSQHVYLSFCHVFHDTILLSGESVAVVVNISNNSSTKLKPKIKLQECKEYRAGSSVTASIQTLGKAAGDTIKGNKEGTVTCQIPIPVDIIPTIRNCEILSVEYCLKVRVIITMSHVISACLFVCS